VALIRCSRRVPLLVPQHLIHPNRHANTITQNRPYSSAWGCPQTNSSASKQPPPLSTPSTPPPPPQRAPRRSPRRARSCRACWTPRGPPPGATCSRCCSATRPWSGSGSGWGTLRRRRVGTICTSE